MPERYELAKQLAQEAGALALKWLEDLKQGAIKIEAKGIQDFVTRADRDVETFLRTAILKAFPDDGLVGEEHEDVIGNGENAWVIDPIDGTANYIRDLDSWCISIGFVCNGVCEFGVIYDPSRDALYHAKRGEGAFKNDTPLAKAKTPDKTPPNPMMVLGHSRRLPLSIYLDGLKCLYENQVEHRRLGSAAMGLALVAEGKAEGYFEADLNAWDCMAGLMLVEEIGCTIMLGADIAKTCKNSPVLVGHPFLEPTMAKLAKLIE